MSLAPIDPVQLTRDLIRRPSVTPVDAGAMDVLHGLLEGLGFTVRRMAFEGIENLYARRGTAGPNLCFAGHTDVVPTGAPEAWSADPFEAELRDGVVIGRGAVDMKGGIAAWVAAVSRVLSAGEVPGSLSFLITGDEEGPALHGTKRVVQALQAEGEVIDACIVGEPSSQQTLGDMIKIGRRGSLNTWITVKGKQGHVAYPDRAANPAPVLARLMTELADHRLDDGYIAFQPSNLEITTLDVGNTATNLIPAEARGRLNIRFNPTHTGESLMGWLDARAKAAEVPGVTVTTEHLWSGDAFLTEPGPFVRMVQDAVEAVTGLRPDASTTGGTSDARFLRAMCPVLELGLVGQTMHQIDERVPVAELEALTRVYERVIRGFFS
ncbi:MAG: succinyl-diaminopimelate desuccinylase [Alphaproteobacteria bacterium]|nr:succinyl-diaminopimelate desuccinylase [Alphaproteobacteria bacterium]MBU1527024.1 succinyl-diaminopimelate desuccinylase [Alphaproteobacteria bacterium]MBU2116705.1 succinyl-diaminopimelate desuccinylase [Alphaproteobacteria bacterium]MBU2352409.1 succinyl-diaminopimelate desuccinylase [Alphaproteobacteria bacterium]MBU2382169.1 succinyl-diaminopimelate desuccinylase [Alphaproteobacteria bacterium]